MNKKTKQKRRKKTAKKHYTTRLGKAAEQTIDTAMEFLPIDRTQVFEWAIHLLRKDMLQENIPEHIRLQILRADITHLEQETKQDKYVLLHSRHRAKFWNKIYDEVNSDTPTHELGTAARGLFDLKNSGILKSWQERNNLILNRIGEYEDLLNSQEEKEEKDNEQT